MILREATEADTPRVVEMAARFLLDSQYGELFDNATTPAAIGAMVKQCLHFGTIIVAELEADDPRWVQGVERTPAAALVGMLAILCVPHPFTGRKYADELAWWVEPRHRGGIIGPKMLWAAEDWATRNGANMVKMVAPAGSAVGAFYERSGYKAVESAYIKTI